MKSSTYQLRKIESENLGLTQITLKENELRIVCFAFYLGDGDLADNYREATQEEYDEYNKPIEPQK